ncbi:MAG: hypothetical protein ACTIJH_05965 [Moraxellaceae bacterium]
MRLSFIGLAITFVLVGCGEDSTSYSEPPTEPSNTTSLACANTTLLTPGTTIDLEYASDDGMDFGFDDFGKRRFHTHTLLLPQDRV